MTTLTGKTGNDERGLLPYLSQLCPGKMTYCDGIHPTGEGYEIIADLIIEELI